MNGLATVIACYGLFPNGPAVVIGAMIVEMNCQTSQCPALTYGRLVEVALTVLRRSA
jgi:hypothetical protein